MGGNLRFAVEVSLFLSLSARVRRVLIVSAPGPAKPFDSRIVFIRWSFPGGNVKLPTKALYSLWDMQ